MTKSNEERPTFGLAENKDLISNFTLALFTFLLFNRNWIVRWQVDCRKEILPYCS